MHETGQSLFLNHNLTVMILAAVESLFIRSVIYSRCCFFHALLTDRAVVPMSIAASSKGQDALQAAQAMQQYSGWEPKEFGQADDADKEDAAPKEEATAVMASSADAGTSGFVYDAASGYWYDSKSGYFYDANTSLYYHPNTKHWYAYNASTGEYTVAGGGSAKEDSRAAGDAAGTSTAAESAIAATESALSAANRGLVSGTTPIVGTGEKKRGAVIGAAPQLSSVGLMAAVQQMEERELEKKALAAQKLKEEQKNASKAPSVPIGPVTGVIHKGKWASRNAAK